jgi:hypothetical protein
MPLCRYAAMQLIRNMVCVRPVHPRTMAENKAHDLLRKHNISLDDVKDRRTSLHHLRHIVRSEELPFDVFKTLVKMRR